MHECKSASVTGNHWEGLAGEVGRDGRGVASLPSLAERNTSSDLGWETSGHATLLQRLPPSRSRHASARPP